MQLCIFVEYIIKKSFGLFLFICQNYTCENIPEKVVFYSSHKTDCGFADYFVVLCVELDSIYSSN